MLTCAAAGRPLPRRRPRPVLPEEFDRAAAGLDTEGRRRLALLVSLLELEPVRAVVAQFRGPGVGRGQLVSAAFIGLARDTPLLTIEVLSQSELRVEELARRFLAALRASIAGETRGGVEEAAAQARLRAAARRGREGPHRGRGARRAAAAASGAAGTAPRTAREVVSHARNAHDVPRDRRTLPGRRPLRLPLAHRRDAAPAGAGRSRARCCSATSARRRWRCSFAERCRGWPARCRRSSTCGTAEYVEPYTDYERTGRLVILRPLALGPWHSGVPHIYVSRGAAGRGLRARSASCRARFR